MVGDGWVPVRPGIMRKPLAIEPGRGIQADIMRIEPDFTDLPHTHNGFEWVYLLEGGFTDQAGEHKKGDFLINTTEGVHQLRTGKEGCTLIIVWTGSVTRIKPG
ncbi:MAG: cupin domain-containing protein [Candidatus Altiarchaeota archaeon]